MAFIASDLYLASGTASLYNSWTDHVTKFDSSSFYNWEQDNEPLYDLDERTHYLWEKMGYPTANGFSGIPGMMMAVSADAGFAGESSGLVYKSVSAAILALPEVIAHPIIIEVASFGNLGTLDLRNLKFKDNGGLEIVNRNFSKIYGKTSTGLKTVLVGVNSQPSSGDLFDTLAATSAVSINTKVCSSVDVSADTRWNKSNCIVYYNRAHGYQDLAVATGPGSSILSVPSTSTSATIFSNANASSLNPLEYDETRDFSSSADFKSYNTLDDSYMTGSNTNVETNGRVDIKVATVSSYPITGYFYGNYFNQINVTNCNGPIYIRNFAVDGGLAQLSNLEHNTVNGFDIQNSRVILENSLAIRCKEAGFKFTSSEVVINRGIVSMRNYTLVTSRIKSSYKSAGIRAINSNIVVSSSPYVSGVEAIIHSTKNYYGIELINSKWSGGTSRKDVTSASGMTFIQSFHNNIGIKMNESTMEVPGRLDVHSNDIGMWMVESDLSLNEGTFEYNQTAGLKADQSHIQYNPDLYQFTKSVDLDGYGQLYFHRNGINLDLNNSQLMYTEGASLPTKYGPFYVKYSTGTVEELGNEISVPAVKISNNSTAKLIRPYITNNQSGFAGSNKVIYGLLANVSDNSKLVCAGDGSKISFLQGPPIYAAQKYTANVYANNNSIVEFQGPTLICNAGIDVLAENGSVINFVPHRDDEGNILASSFDLSSATNHSLIELHSTRACLVANKNSIINMENLGDFNSFWPASQTSSTDYNQNNGLNIQTYVSAGYMQFYPNGQDETAVIGTPTRYDIGETGGNAGLETNNVVTTDSILLDWNLVGANADILKYSTGGMCVRAIDGSIVNVKNVHFPCGWDNTSGILYDVSSGGNCDLLRIWNIGPDSFLNASYCSVSGLYPSLAGYYGPSAVYLSGGVPASAAPTTVPDTGRLSVLDFYGASGATAGTNYGPFRLMVAVDGAAKFLNYYTTGLIYNSAYQTWAQGYNPSGSVSAAPEVSSIYKTLGSASAFLTTSAMIDSSYRTRIRLDESAADTFANAKNGATARSGRVPFCTIYRSRNTEGSESFSTSAIGHGFGLLSVNIFDLSRKN
jgi:hypothetical protein